MKAVDAAMVQAASIARDVAAYVNCHRFQIAGELQHRPVHAATLDELLERIKGELSKLAPILDIELGREPEGPRTKGGLTVAN